MDGLEASRHIDQEGPCPVVLLSECGKSEWVRDACSLSAVQAYLVKPVRERDLEPTIELALARFRRIEQLEREAKQLRNILGPRSTITPATENLTTKRSRPPQEAPEQVQRRARIKKAGMERAA